MKNGPTRGRPARDSCGQLRSAFGADVALLLSVVFDEDDVDAFELSVELGMVLMLFVLLELPVAAGVAGVVAVDEEFGLAACWSVVVAPVCPAWLVLSLLVCAIATPSAASKAAPAADAVSFFWKLRMLDLLL
jgi:hypothetical protein